MRLWELARYALENALRSRLRTMLTIAGVAIASGALVSMVGFILGLREQVETPIRSLGLLNNIEVNQNDESPPLTDEAMNEFENLPGVEYVVPQLRLSQVHLRRRDGEDDLKCNVFGIPREAGIFGFSQEFLTSGRFFSLEDSNEIIISQDLVEQLGFEVSESAIGNKVLLIAGGLVAQANDSFLREERELELTIVGVYEPPRFASSFTESSALLPQELMRNMPPSWMEAGLRQLQARGQKMQGYGRVVVRVKSPSDVMRVQKRLEEMKFGTYSMMDRMDEFKEFFLFMEVLLTAVGTVALVVAGLGILNTMSMTVMERYQEIGVYKAIGASPGDIRWMFLVEAAVVGLFGGLCGLVLARVVSWILAWAINAYVVSQGAKGPGAVFEFPMWLLVLSVLYSILVSIISGLYPASQAAKVDPIAALRRG